MLFRSGMGNSCVYFWDAAVEDQGRRGGNPMRTPRATSTDTGPTGPARPARARPCFLLAHCLPTLMDWREGILILYSSNLSIKVLAYLLTLALITIFSGGLHGFLFLLVPFGLDFLGAGYIRLNHPAFQEDVLGLLEADCLRACGIDKASPHFSHVEFSGSLDHWRLRDLKTDIRYSMMTPRVDFVVIAARTGRIFPLKSYFKVAYQTDDAGTRDVYYSDIASVELSGKVLTMATASGESLPYTAQGDKAEEAAALLRQRLREYKSRRGETPDE